MKKLIIVLLIPFVLLLACEKDTPITTEKLKEEIRDLEIRIPQIPIYVNRDCSTPKEIEVELFYQKNSLKINSRVDLKDSMMIVALESENRRKRLNTLSNTNYISKFYLDSTEVKVDSSNYILNLIDIQIPSKNNYRQLRIDIEKDSGIYYSVAIPINYIKTGDEIDFISRSYPLTGINNWSEVQIGDTRKPFFVLNTIFGLNHFPWPNYNDLYNFYDEHSLKRGVSYDCKFNLNYKDSIVNDSTIRVVEIAGYVDKNGRKKIDIEPRFRYLQKYGDWFSLEELSAKKLRLQDWGYNMKLNADVNMSDSSIVLPCFTQFYNNCYARRYQGILTDCQEFDTLNEESIYITYKIDLLTRQVNIES